MAAIMAQVDFERIYLEYKEKVWRLIAKYLPSRQDREDLFQEIFLKIHRALPRFRGEASPGTWIYRITVNAAISYLEKQKRHRRLKDVFALFRSEEAVEDAEPHTDAVLWKPLEKLNPRQRMILLLADVEEQKLEEIAAMLKIPIGTVKSNLHRAREIVKKEVMKDDGL